MKTWLLAVVEVLAMRIVVIEMLLEYSPSMAMDKDSGTSH